MSDTNSINNNLTTTTSSVSTQNDPQGKTSNTTTNNNNVIQLDSRTVSSQTSSLVSQVVNLQISQDLASQLLDQTLQNILDLSNTPHWKNLADRISKEKADFLNIVFYYKEVISILDNSSVKRKVLYDFLSDYYFNKIKSNELKMTALMATLHQNSNAAQVLGNELLSADMIIKVGNATNGNIVLGNITDGYTSFGQNFDLNQFGDALLPFIFSDKDTYTLLGKYADVLLGLQKTNGIDVLVQVIAAIKSQPVVADLIKNNVLPLDKMMSILSTPQGKQTIAVIAAISQNQELMDFFNKIKWTELEDWAIVHIFKTPENAKAWMDKGEKVLSAAKTGYQFVMNFYKIAKQIDDATGGNVQKSIWNCCKS